MVEFAVVGPLFVLVLLMMVTVVIYEMERSFIVNSVTTATRTAVSSAAGAAPTAIPTPADLYAVAEQAKTNMAHTLLGTAIIDLNSPTCSVRSPGPIRPPFFGPSCAALIAAQPCITRGVSPIGLPRPIGTLYVYAKYFPPLIPNACSATNPAGLVQVVASGDASSVLSVVHVGIPITIQSTAVRVNYQTGDQ
jgi:hypothetical protein